MSQNCICQNLDIHSISAYISYKIVSVYNDTLAQQEIYIHSGDNSEAFSLFPGETYAPWVFGSAPYNYRVEVIIYSNGQYKRMTFPVGSEIKVSTLLRLGTPTGTPSG